MKNLQLINGCLGVVMACIAMSFPARAHDEGADSKSRLAQGFARVGMGWGPDEVRLVMRQEPTYPPSTSVTFGVETMRLQYCEGGIFAVRVCYKFLFFERHLVRKVAESEK